MEDNKIISKYKENLSILKSELNSILDNGEPDKNTEEMACNSPPLFVSSLNSAFNIVKPKAQKQQDDMSQLIAEKDEKIKILQSKVDQATTLDNFHRQQLQMMKNVHDSALKLRNEKVEQLTSLMEESHEYLRTVLKKTKKDKEAMTQKNTELKNEIHRLQLKITEKDMKQLQFNNEEQKAMNPSLSCFPDEEIRAYGGACSMR